MKKLLFVIPMLIVFASCQHKAAEAGKETASALSSDSCMLHAIQAIGDPNLDLMDIKDEISQLIDTMQVHAEFNPDEDIRIGAKSLATLLAQRILAEEENHPGNEAALDSLFMRLTDVTNTWYLFTPPQESDLHPMMMQAVIRQDDELRNHITQIDVNIIPEGNRVVIFFPEDAVAWPIISFSNDGNNSEAFPLEDIVDAYERTDSTNMVVVYDQKLIDAMLSNQWMFIGYLDDNEHKKDVERFQRCALLLTKFQQQYNAFLSSLAADDL